MPLTTLTYNDNEQEHKSFADTLGQMQGMILKGTLTKDTSHAYYAGHELRTAGVTFSGVYLKKDCPGKGATANGRSQNRIVVATTTDGKLVEDWAVAWRHDDRLLELSDGFFKRAKTMRDYIVNLK
jgi:hypothetical protein